MSDYYREQPDHLPLFAPPAPSVRGSATSQAAAATLTPQALNALQRRVLAFIAARLDGATDEEIAAGCGLNPSTARPRRIELERRGLVVEAGARRAASGRRASVWKATAASR